VSGFVGAWALFVAKLLTVVVLGGGALLAVLALARRGQAHAGDPGSLEVEKLNDRLRRRAQGLREALLPKAERRRAHRAARRAEKAAVRAAEPRRRVFVLDFKGDIRASQVAALREEVTAIAGVAAEGDAVLLRLENFGGAVHEHGLAAAQLQRLRDRGLRLTVAVDRGAASGGYLMACVAHEILAAPFAVLGSIGVIAQIPNFQRALEARGVDVEQLTAGRYKRTVTMFGRTTDDDRAKLRAELDDIHRLFKDVVARYRPALDLDRVATGEHWYGTRALELGLVDAIGTSDDRLLALAESADLFRVTVRPPRSLPDRLRAAVRAALDEGWAWVAERQQDSRLP
jgi:serine protease SohB